MGVDPGEAPAASDARPDGFPERLTLSLGRPDRRRQARTYVPGLLLESERKSVQPLAGRLGTRASRREAVVPFRQLNPELRVVAPSPVPQANHFPLAGAEDRGKGQRVVFAPRVAARCASFHGVSAAQSVVQTQKTILLPPRKLHGESGIKDKPAWRNWQTR